MKSARNVLLGTILLGALIACADGATAPVPQPLRVSAFVGGDPPPPPADGIGVPPFGNNECTATPPPPGTPETLILMMPVSANVKARILVNPPETYVVIDFSSGGENVEVSDDARIRIIRDRMTTSGSIRIPFMSAVPSGPQGLSPEIIWDLSSVKVSFESRPDANYVTVVAPVYYPGGFPVHDSFECPWGVIPVLYPVGGISYKFPKSQ